MRAVCPSSFIFLDLFFQMFIITHLLQPNTRAYCSVFLTSTYPSQPALGTAAVHLLLHHLMSLTLTVAPNSKQEHILRYDYHTESLSSIFCALTDLLSVRYVSYSSLLKAQIVCSVTQCRLVNGPTTYLSGNTAWQAKKLESSYLSSPKLKILRCCWTFK